MLAAGTGRPLTLSDLSPHGCNIGASHWSFRVGQFLSLKFANAAKVQGIVRWMRDGQLGIEFVHPLSAGVIDLMAPSD